MNSEPTNRATSKREDGRMSEPTNDKARERDAGNQQKSAMFERAEKAIIVALDTARSAHRVAMLKQDWEHGESHPSLALMELCVRSLSQANDAARYARHSLLFVNPFDDL